MCNHVSRSDIAFNSAFVGEGELSVRHEPLSLHALMVIGLLAVLGGWTTSSVSADEASVVMPLDAKSLRPPEGKIVIDTQKPGPLCQWLADAAAAHWESGKNFCSVPDVAKDPSFRRPSWTRLDVHKNEELVEHILFMNWLDGRRIEEPRYKFGSEAYQHTEREFWKGHWDWLSALQSVDWLVLERAIADVDNDGQVEDVYRLTRLSPVTLKREVCQEAESEIVPLSFLYVPPSTERPSSSEALNSQLSGHLDIFLSGRTTYIGSFDGGGFSVTAPKAYGAGHVAIYEVCSVHAERISR
jgi:hypothetical protein